MGTGWDQPERQIPIPHITAERVRLDRSFVDDKVPLLPPAQPYTAGAPKRTYTRTHSRVTIVGSVLDDFSI